MDFCVLDLNSFKVGTELKKLVGSNDNLAVEMLSAAISDKSFNDDFQTWYKETYNTKKEADAAVTTAASAKKYAKAIFDYYYYKHPSVDTFVKDSAKTDMYSIYGYTSMFEREAGKQHIATTILDEFNKLQRSGVELSGNKLNYYITTVKAKWLDKILNIIADDKNKSIEDIRKEYDEAQDKTAYLENALGGENISISNKNILAVYKELFGSMQKAIAYVTEVFNNDRLKYVRQEAKDDIDDPNALLAVDALGELNDNNNGDGVTTPDNDFDTSIFAYNNHIGAYSSFMTHVGPRIFNYFNSLRKYQPGSSEIEDTNNTYGIAECMDAAACSSMMYNSVSYSSLDTMIRSIERIGKTVRGFEAFIKFADTLRSDPDFAYEVFKTFSKVKMTRMECVLKDGKVETRVSNLAADTVNSFRFQLENDIKSSVLENDADDYTLEIQKIRTFNPDKTQPTIISALTKAKQSKTHKLAKDRNNAKKEAQQDYLILRDKVITLIKAYYPSVERDAIIAYAETANNATDNIEQKLINLDSLINDISDAVKESKASRTEFNRIQTLSDEIDKYNADLKAKQATTFIHPEQFKTKISVYSSDYITTGQKSAYMAIASKLLPYSIVKTQLNSRNIHGNNQSNLINDSLITQLKRMFEVTEFEEVKDKDGKTQYLKSKGGVIEKWFESKFRSSQYRYSTFLVTQLDKGGNVLNPNALFINLNGSYVINKDAPKLIQLSLFDGVGNLDDGSNASYSEMTKGDYLPASFISYFKTTIPTGENLPIGNFFLRTPSDAPKNFMLRMAKHNTLGLYKVANDNEIRENAREIARESIKLITVDEFKNTYRGEARTNSNPYSQLDDIGLGQLLSGKSVFVQDPTNSVRVIDEETNKVYVTFITANGNFIVAEGEQTKRGKGIFLKNPNVVAVLNAAGVNNALVGIEEVPEYIINGVAERYYNKLLKHDITINGKTYAKANYEFDKTHPVFELVKNQIKQELLNAAVALNHYFELEEVIDESGYIYYIVKTDNDNNPIFRKDRDNKTGYKFYHLDENGEVLASKTKYNDDGTIKVKQGTLNGAVFGSTKTVIGIEEDVLDENQNPTGAKRVVRRNFVNEIITSDIDNHDEGTINLLYGVADGTNIRIVKNAAGDKVIDINLTEAQENSIDNKLVEYLTAYINKLTTNIESKRDFIKDTPITTESIVDYAINQWLAHCTFDELFDGDTKFYKDSQTVLKRVKESQGSGVAYGVNDYTANAFDFTVDTEPATSMLNSGTVDIPIYDTVTNPKTGKLQKKRVGTETFSIQDLFNGIVNDGKHVLTDDLKGIRQTVGFRAITIKNSVRTNKKALDELVGNLVPILQKEGFSKEDALSHARDILYGPVVRDKQGNVEKNEDGSDKRRGGFTETKVNDAQSYITFKEWVRRIAARGQLKQYMPLILKLLDPTSVLTASDLAQFVQVQKNFYYDMHYDERYGIEVPRQIKNAEFVLIPRLIKGTQLEQVARVMEAAGIDQLNTVETSKAANEKVLTLWDNDGNLTITDVENGVETVNEDKFNKFVDEAKSNRQDYWYKNLYTQQETPQHMNSENKAGIQIIKKMIDNLPNDDSELGKLKSEYFELYTQNIEDSFDRFLDEFGVEKDENGNILLDENGNIKGLDIKKFYDRLKEELLRTGMDSNLEDYVTLVDGRPEMPSYMNNIITKFESVIQSVFNKDITRQKLPGFHSAQITNIGWRKITEDLPNAKESAIKRHQAYKDYVKENGELTFKNGKLVNEDKVKFSAWLTDYSKKVYGNHARELRYHPNGEGYIEIMLSASYLGIDRNSEHYKNMSDEDILKELEEEGLDMLIGYRIPTEGKQSVCNMKVVGLIDDAYGSTIVVPDDWVSQTGSDFDIDSVYGINYETYKDRDGRVHLIKYRKSNKDLEHIEWFRYLQRSGNKKVNGKLNDILYDALHDEEKALFENLPKELQNKIRAKQAALSKEIEEKALERNEAYLYRLDGLIKYLGLIIKHSKNNEAKIKPLLFYHSLSRIYTLLDAQNGSVDADTLESFNSIIGTHISELDNLAKEEKLMSFEKYSSLPDVRRNSRRARNNRLLDIMISILKDPNTLEENLSRSNFDDLVFARNQVMSANVAALRAARSPYDVIDQIDYQEEAMSGAKLKAFSVTLDTFCSVANTVQPTLSMGVPVVYSEDETTSSKVASMAFDGVQRVGKSQFKIVHNTYGWSKNNRNVVGKILTAYSSQTTAFILDAIKEGSIPNLNDYTFSTFKTLANIGIDYRTALAFLMQPGVTSIVDIHNASKSIFSTFNENPVEKAVKNIAKQLGIRNADSLPINSVISKLNKKYKSRFNKLFNVDNQEEFDISLGLDKSKNIPLIVSKLINRLKEQGEFDSSSPVEDKLLFDLGTIIIFNKLHSAANTIGDIARCCNPDKFGAKQTVFATEQVFDAIDKCVFDRTRAAYDGNTMTAPKKTKRKPVLEVNGEHILKAIYPSAVLEQGTVADIVENVVKSNDLGKSKYPSLYAFLKYATATSKIVTRNILETQDPSFVSLVKGIERTFSVLGFELSEDIYNDMQKYTLATMYNEVPSIKYPIHVRLEDGTVKLVQDDFVLEGSQNGEVSDSESNRIRGYGHLPSLKRDLVEVTPDNKRIHRYVDVDIKDINNPTNEEIAEFEQLSPAQKIQWIKQNFSNAGIFNFINVSLYNGANRGRFAGMQTIEFIEQNLNQNIIYNEFNKVFYSTNPLLISAAIDIIKYAVQVEGLQMSARGITKVISNDVLLGGDIADNGTQNNGYATIPSTEGIGFVGHIQKSMNELTSGTGPYADLTFIEKLYENYLRSHEDCGGIKKIYLTTDERIDSLGMHRSAYGTYLLQPMKRKFTKVDETTGEVETEIRNENEDDFNERLKKMGIRRGLSYQYVRIVPKNKSTAYNSILYKVRDFGTHVIMYPLSNLTSTENRDWSVNEEYNNGFIHQDAYEYLIKKYNSERETAKWEYDWLKQTVEDYKKEHSNTYAKSYIKRGLKIPAKQFNLTIEAENNNGMRLVLDNMLRHFKENPNTRLYIRSQALSSYIFAEGVENGTSQVVKFGEKDIRGFQIVKVNWNGRAEINGIKVGNIRKKYLVDKADTSGIKDESMKKIIEDAQEYGATKFDNIFVVVPVVENNSDNSEANAASLEELEADTLEFHISLRSKGDETSAQLLENARIAGVDLKKDNIKETIKNNIEVTTREIASAAKQLSDNIVGRFNRFRPIPGEDNMFYNILDDEVQNIIKKDAQAMDDYMYTLNLAKAFIEKYDYYISFNATSEDEDIRMYIEDIKASVKKVSDLALSQAADKLNATLADKISTNPLIKEGLIDVMDGYWRTYGSMWAFNDIMENGNPLLQIILKDVFQDLEAKQKAIPRVKRNYRSKVNDIIRRAKEAGQTVDLRKIIDSDRGIFIEDFKPEFREEAERLKNNVKEAAKQGLGSIAHLTAKLEWDEFKAKYVNQEAKPEYYQKLARNMRAMLFNPDGTLADSAELFSEYMKLYYRRLNIYNYMSEGGINEVQQQELQKIQEEMYNLYRDRVYVKDGEIVTRPVRDPEAEYSEEKERELKLYGVDVAYKLHQYIDGTKQIQDKYYKYDSVYGFEEALQRNLAIVRSYEDRDSNGIPQRPMSWLQNQPEYVAAKNWIRDNARFELALAEDEDDTALSIGSKIKKALKTLGKSGSARIKGASDVLRKHNNGKTAYDAHGIPDGTQLSDEELDEIKKAQEKTFQVEGLPPRTDRILISNARPTSEVYKSEFYSRMSTGGHTNLEYLDVVTKLNKLLAPLYSNLDGIIHFERIEDTPEGLDTLRQIVELYTKLYGIKKTDATATGETKAFIENNVDFKTNTTVFDLTIEATRDKSREFKELMVQILYERTEDGAFRAQDGEAIPNRFLFSYAEPKEEVKERFIDTEKAEAINLIESSYRRVKTKYYYQAMSEAMRKAEEDPSFSYAEWYDKNHIYNPYTREMQPLDCWLTYEIKDDILIESGANGKWVPKTNQRTKAIRDGHVTVTVGDVSFDEYRPEEDMHNDDWDGTYDIYRNYRVSEGSPYNSGVELNDFEKEMKEHLKSTLYENTRTNQGTRFLDKGYLPREVRPEKTTMLMAANEIGKLFGFNLSTENGRKDFNENVDFATDFTPLTPMTDLLRDKKLSPPIEERLKKLNERKPQRTQFEDSEEGDIEYQTKLQEWNEEKKKIEDEQLAINNSLLNKNWYDVIEHYIEKTANYNAVLDNKQKLYYLLNALRNQRTFLRKYNMTGDLKRETKVDVELIKQYENVVRRLLWDQWKEPEDKFTRYAANLQSFASANYMMLNIRGGIANVTLGETGILAEAAAGEFIGKKDWGFGTNEWRKGMFSYAQSFMHETRTGEQRSFSKQDAIAKAMNVVDYDENAGVVRELNLAEYSKRLRDIMFSPQSMGEHFMQNSVLFAMLHSHKLVTMDDGTTTYMNKGEYIRYRQGQLLSTILTEEQQVEFRKFKESIKGDKNKLKDYAWFRKDALTEWIYLHTDDKQIDKFIKLRKAQEKQIIEEFNKMQDMYSQMTLGSDGHLAFVSGSKLAEMSETLMDNLGTKVTQAEWILGGFTERVRKVNNKIHGVYNRMGQAYIEKKWWGSLVMQYHKHLPIGLLKRYAIRGKYNETRGSVDLGMLPAIQDFLSLNARKIQKDAGLTDDNVAALEHLQYCILHITDYVSQLKTTWHILPAHTKANILRNTGDLVGVVSSLATTIALWYIAGDDDDIKDNFGFNLALYEADRLCSETFMYNPIGGFGEVKKLMSTPIAAQSILSDALSSANQMIQWMLTPDYDMTYHSGRFSGENKLSVYVQRRIPMWSAIRSLADITTSNQYYKVGHNAATLIQAKKIGLGLRGIHEE